MNFFDLFSQGASLFNFNFTNVCKGSSLTTNAQLTNTKSFTHNHILKEPNSSFLPTQVESKTKPVDNTEGINNDNTVELFTKQQQLINQYMHLNLQLLSKKLQNLQQNDKPQTNQQSPANNEVKSSKKKIKKENSCGHPEKEHYAKGMCNNCYHKYGRQKKPWNCPHNKLYANGMCQNCYINSYNKKKRQERAQGNNNEMQLASELKQQDQ